MELPAGVPPVEELANKLLGSTGVAQVSKEHALHLQKTARSRGGCERSYIVRGGRWWSTFPA